MIGVVNGTVEWIFSFPDRLSITISGADRLLDVAREKLAADLWDEVSRVTGVAASLPPWQIIKERRATFAALPAEDAKRPPAGTRWSNLVLAGDWTATGLPATIEGAIRSGNTAALRLAGTAELHMTTDASMTGPSFRAASQPALRLERQIQAATRAMLDRARPTGHWLFVSRPTRPFPPSTC